MRHDPVRDNLSIGRGIVAGLILSAVLWSMLGLLVWWAVS